MRIRERKTPITVGISSCLLGQKVRFDGQHKRYHYSTDILAEYFRFIPVCPEVEVGMGVPRETIRLEGSPDNPSLIGTKTKTDWTNKMNSYSRQRIAKDDIAGISGYILKKDSPTCGMERVKVYENSPMPKKQGRGLYAARLIESHPLLPVEEEGRLNDPIIRENFIERVFAYHNLQQLFAGGHFKRGEVVVFHSANKYLIMSHSNKHYKIMGQLVAAIKKHKPSEFRDLYMQQFMEALAIKATVKKHTNVLQHILGFLKDHLDSRDKQSIIGVIEDYRKGLVPLVVPVTLLGHFVDRFEIEYIANQTYLKPHPKELMLRNHA